MRIMPEVFRRKTPEESDDEIFPHENRPKTDILERRALCASL